jgi:hypothetical protein
MEHYRTQSVPALAQLLDDSVAILDDHVRSPVFVSLCRLGC